MAYFTAVITRQGDSWTSRDLDVSEAEDLLDLADRLRTANEDDQPVVLLLEREDAWFAVVRVDGDEDPRVFVSDGEAALISPFAGALGLDPDETYEGPVGDSDVLIDLGTPPEELEDLTGDEAPLPSDALSTLAEAAGFAELLDGLR